MIIPIGIDCTPCNLLVPKKLRRVALPFDWNVSYKGVSDIFKSDFKDFIPDEICDDAKYNDKVGVKFVHHKFPMHKSNYNRRITRLKNILAEAKEKVLFFRMGHDVGAHTECPDVVKDDIQDMIELDSYLSQSYPNLKYKILLILLCNECYDLTKEYNISDNIICYPITPEYKKIEYWFSRFYEQQLINLLDEYKGE